MRLAVKMCNIAGYVGKKQAAPILIEMMRREEGYAGGFYTGITVHDGKHLVSDKVIGGLDHLLAETECRDFVGTCGFIHSRSKSGGNREWAQPFLSGDRRSSLIANGASVRFRTEAMMNKSRDMALMLEKRGYTFGSRVSGAIGSYPLLSDGTAIHSTDLRCQYLTYLIDEGMPIDKALGRMMSELPCEAVFVLMREEMPDGIFLTRINYPMTVGVAEDGDVYFATTRLAFPEDVSFRKMWLLPPKRVFCVKEGGCLASSAVVAVEEQVASITPKLEERAYTLFLNALTPLSEPVTASSLIPSYAEVWPEEEIDQNEPLFYTLIERLAAEGRLGVSPIPVEGAAEGYIANRFGIYLK